MIAFEWEKIFYDGNKEGKMEDPKNKIEELEDKIEKLENDIANIKEVLDVQDEPEMDEEDDIEDDDRD
tara:strand:- start:108 stop:311 length:204 start_codon:yes stop_codon:yes gene_type:complete